MTALLAPPRPVVQQQSYVPYRITVDQYLRMTQAGILGKYDHCELIEGVLVAKMSRDPPHDNTLHKLSKRLLRLAPDEFQCRDQKALILDTSVPEPDIVVARGDEDTYARRHPTAADTVLVVQVADSSLNSDCSNAPMFARNAIPIYWIVNIVDSTSKSTRSRPGRWSRQHMDRVKIMLPEIRFRSSWMVCRSVRLRFPNFFETHST